MKPEQVDDLGDILMGNIPLHRKRTKLLCIPLAACQWKM